jgi:hypothetical protein
MANKSKSALLMALGAGLALAFPEAAVASGITASPETSSQASHRPTIPAGATYRAMTLAGFDAAQVRRAGNHVFTTADGTQFLLKGKTTSGDSAKSSSYLKSHSLAWLSASHKQGAIAGAVHPNLTVYGDCGDSYFDIAQDGPHTYLWVSGFDLTAGAIEYFSWGVHVVGVKGKVTDSNEWIYHTGGSYTGVSGGTYHTWFYANATDSHLNSNVLPTTFAGSADGDALTTDGEYCTSGGPDGGAYIT